MGNTAGIKTHAQGVQNPTRAKGWHSQKVTKFQVVFNSVCRFTHNANELYNLLRHEREPWKSLLANAADEFEEERRLQAEEENTETTEVFHSMIWGTVPGKHIKRHGREVWVFVSSTFTDTRLERDLLMEDVYPYIRDYCREIGLEFNVVDFRWGIRNTACNKHLASEICLKEVQRCKENSVGPFFVGIIGQKYGFRPLPYTLPEEIFLGLLDSIKKQAEEDPEMREAVQLLEQWYKVDWNSLERIVVLQPIDDIFPRFSQNDPKDVGRWKQAFAIMQPALFNTIRRSKLSPETINELTWSVTEGEITQGIKDLDRSQPDRMFVFHRNLTNFDESVGNAYQFIDYTRDGEVDGDAQIKLGELRNKLRKLVPEDASCRYRLRFMPSSDEMLNDEANREHIRKFLDQFCQYMIDSIREGALAEATALDHVDYAEVLSHSVFCRERAEVFVGRSDVLEIITNHLLNPHGGKPYAIHGEGGSGKSSIIAKVFSNFTERWKTNTASGRPIMVIRFIGITPASSNIRDLLFSICVQLCYCLDWNISTLPREYKKLESKFHEMLHLASAETPIVIFLDALDQLTNENEAQDLNWLPSSLPDYVHMIVTVRPGAGGVFASYKKLGNSECSLEVLPMNEEDRNEMIKLRLKKLGRCLTRNQMDYVMSAYGKGQPTALYLHLACNIAASWKSYTPLSKCKLAQGTMGIIEQLFMELEKNHGKVFVSHTLGYLTASNNGLSSNELIDVLSCDEDVLEDVFQYHVPPIRRLPVLLWTRLRLDLGDYLVESGADKAVVYRWYHRLFHVVAKNRYLLTENGQRIHQNLANYFLGRWAHTPKPYRIKGTSKVEVAHRRVQDQPLILDPSKLADPMAETPRSGDTVAKKRYNSRKLTELPVHLIAAEMWKEAEQVMCSIPWCEAKCSTGRIYQLLDELSQAATKCNTANQHAMGCFYRMVRANSQILQQHPDLMCQQAMNEPDASRCVQIGKAYCKEKGSKVQFWNDLSKSQAPDPEVMTFPHPAPVTLVAFSHMCKHLATACNNNTVRVWRVASGALEMTIDDVNAVKLAWPMHCFWLAVLEPNGIKIYGTGTGKGLAKGQFVCAVTTEIEPIAKVYIPKEGKQLFLATHGRVEIYNTTSGKLLQKHSLKCRPKGMEFTPNGKYLVMAHNIRIYTYDYTKNVVIKEFDIEDRVTNLNNTILALSKDGRHLTGVLPIGTFRWRTDNKSGAPKGEKLMLNCQGGPAVLSPELDHIALLEGENYLKVLKLKPKVEWCRLEAHKEPVTCADFGNTSKYLLLATGSKDHKVRLWDAGSFTGHVTARVENHAGSVTGCVFSPDGSKAASSSTHDGAWLWNATITPPRVSLYLTPKASCELRKVACMSNDGEFVVGFCGENDIDIWNTRGPRQSDNITVECAHRMMPYVNPTYFFVTFNKDALVACFSTSNRIGIVFLCEVVPQKCLQDWRAKPEQKPSFFEYSQSVLQFDHTVNYKVVDAALREDGEHLVTVAKKLADANLLDTIVSHKKQNYMDGEVLVHVWNVQRQEPIFKRTIADKRTRHHSLGFLTEYPILFMHEEFKEVATTKGTPVRTGGHQRSVPTSYTVTRILHPESGEILGKLTIQGDYNTITMPRESTLDRQMSLEEAMHRIMISCRTRDGVFKSCALGKNNPGAKFVLKSASVTAYAFSSDNQSAMVGFDSGSVRFLRYENSKGKTFLGES